MMQCPACSAENAETGRFCSACGSPLRGSYLGTVSSGENGKPVTPPADASRFDTGTILANRYRIVGLLGKGGMGEVYRADDLKLDVRRLWPRLMISWSRLLAGNYRDPMVGRDVLIGCVFGTVGVAIPFLLEWAHLIFGFGGRSVYTGSALVTLGSVFSVPGDLLKGVVGGMESSLLFLFLLLISYALFRRRWLAIGITWILISIFNALFFGADLFQWTVSMIAAAFLVFAISRFGILTQAVYTSCYIAISTSPITSDFSRWYAVNGLITLAVILALAVISLRISLAGQPLIQRSLLPD